MLPPETLPPGDPSGGVVYLRNEILSLQKALCLFLNMDVLQGGVVSTSPNPLSWRTTPCRLSTTAYSLHMGMHTHKTYIYMGRVGIVCFLFYMIMSGNSL